MPALKGDYVDFIEFCLGVIYKAIADEVILPEDEQGDRIFKVLHDMELKSIDKRLAKLFISSPELRQKLRRAEDEIMGTSDENLRFSVVPEFKNMQVEKTHESNSMRRILRNIER